MFLLCALIGSVIGLKMVSPEWIESHSLIGPVELEPDKVISKKWILLPYVKNYKPHSSAQDATVSDFWQMSLHFSVLMQMVRKEDWRGQFESFEPRVKSIALVSEELLK